MENKVICIFCGDIDTQGDSIHTRVVFHATCTGFTESYFCPMCKRWYEKNYVLKKTIYRGGAILWQ